MHRAKMHPADSTHSRTNRMKARRSPISHSGDTSATVITQITNHAPINSDHSVQEDWTGLLAPNRTSSGWIAGNFNFAGVPAWTSLNQPNPHVFVPGGPKLTKPSREMEQAEEVLQREGKVFGALAAAAPIPICKWSKCHATGSSPGAQVFDSSY